jgi:hypothetical protein
MEPIALPSINVIHISFEYPRSHTCSICDKFLAERKALEQRTETSETEKRKLTVLNEIHKKKAQEFYNRRNAKAKSNIEYEAITIDFQKCSLIKHFNCEIGLEW